MDIRNKNCTNDCFADSCVINDKSKEREKRKIVCASPGCLKEFHAACIGRQKASDKELNNIFFVCTRCETYLSYSADIAKKNIMSEIDSKINDLKKSLYQAIDEKIGLEFSRISTQTNTLIDASTQRFGEKIDGLRIQVTEANDFVLNTLQEKHKKMKQIEEEMSNVKSHCLNEINEAKASLKVIASQVASLDSRKRKKAFLIKNFPENTNSVNGKCITSCQDAVDAVAEALKLEARTLHLKDAYRIGKVREDGRPRMIFVKASEKTVKLFLSKARFLKHASYPLNRVFVQEDLPPEVNIKLAEMRKRAFEHRTNNPGQMAFVRGKKLFIDGNLVDEAKQDF